jgi:hypothetical protein
MDNYLSIGSQPWRQRKAIPPECFARCRKLHAHSPIEVAQHLMVAIVRYMKSNPRKHLRVQTMHGEARPKTRRAGGPLGLHAGYPIRLSARRDCLRSQMLVVPFLAAFVPGTTRSTQDVGSTALQGPRQHHVVLLVVRTHSQTAAFELREWHAHAPKELPSGSRSPSQVSNKCRMIVRVVEWV